MPPFGVLDWLAQDPPWVGVSGNVHPLCGSLNALLAILGLSHQPVHSDSALLGMACSSRGFSDDESASGASRRRAVVEHVLSEDLPIADWRLLSWLWYCPPVLRWCDFVFA